jgi:DNA-binding CsgD family transcriptional regulator
MTENELGRSETSHYLDELDAMASESDDLDTRLRVAVGRQGIGAMQGSLAGVWEVCLPLISHASHAADPMARTTFLANLAYLCLSRADYSRGVALATKALDECRILGFDFARGYCLITLALAQAGLRKFGSAHDSVRQLTHVAEAQDNTYLRCTVQIASIRVALAQGRPEHALRGHDPEYAEVIPAPAAQGEYLGALALAAAAAGDAHIAETCVRMARGVTTAIEARFFSSFAEFLYSEPRTSENLALRVRDAIDACFSDAFVLTYRSSPGLLDLLPRDRSLTATVATLMTRANDHHLIRSHSPLAAAVPDTIATLTAREREVLGLLAEGLSNAEIAERLFITTSTAKVHVQHILKKLGAKTRLQAALQVQHGLTERN